jgi:hypothetical protein
MANGQFPQLPVASSFSNVAPTSYVAADATGYAHANMNALIALEAFKATERGQPYKKFQDRFGNEPIPLHMPSYGNLLELAGVPSDFFQWEMNRRREEGFAVKNIKSGDVPGGLVAYQSRNAGPIVYLPEKPGYFLQQGFFKHANDKSVAPDTVLLHKQMLGKSDPRRGSIGLGWEKALKSVLHEDLHKVRQAAHRPSGRFSRKAFSAYENEMFDSLVSKFGRPALKKLTVELLGGEEIDYSKYKRLDVEDK